MTLRLERHRLAVIPLLLVAACAWSVPASPGLNARLRTPRTELVPAGASSTVAAPRAASAAAHDPATEALYRNRCGQCHAPFEPTAFSAAEWPIYVHKYGPRAGLFGAERERVLRWLQANAR